MRQVTTRKSETSLKTYTFFQSIFVFLILGPRRNSREVDLNKTKKPFYVGPCQQFSCLMQVLYCTVTARKSEFSLNTYTFFQTIFGFFMLGPRPNSREWWTLRPHDARTGGRESGRASGRADGRVSGRADGCAGGRARGMTGGRADGRADWRAGWRASAVLVAILSE